MRQSHDDCFGKSTKLVVLLVFLMVAGCHRHTLLPVEEIKQLPTHVDGASDRQIIALQTRLNSQGVHVVTMGQDYLVSIPSALIFATESPQLKWTSYQLLNDVVCFLQQFRKINTNVNAFSNQYVSPRREKSLTRARARAVAEYLWSQDINTRFIFTQGFGSDKPISAYKLSGDSSPNSRIEITFRRAVA